MSVRMTSDYNRYNGGTNTLEWAEGDMIQLSREGNAWKLVFKSATYTTNVMTVSDVMRDYIKASEVAEDYISKDELTSQLEERLESLKARAEDAGKRGDWLSAYNNRAQAYQVEAIIRDVEIDEINIP